MKYAYAIIFAVLISPIESWLGGFSGLLLSSWERFYSHLATGALFAYAAILSTEALVRLALLPGFARDAHPKLIKSTVLGTVVCLFFSLILLVFLWITNRPFEQVPSAAHGVAIIVALVAIGMLLLSVHVEENAKRAIDEATSPPNRAQAPQEVQPRGRARSQRAPSQ